MVCEGTKRIVVIKDIPSNFIEQAIFILKSDNGSKDEKPGSAKPEKQDGKNVFLLKEAELIIENYIKDNKMQAAARRERDLKQSMLKRLFTAGNLVNLALISGIVLLAILMIKLF